MDHRGIVSGKNQLAGMPAADSQRAFPAGRATRMHRSYSKIARLLIEDGWQVGYRRFHRRGLRADAMQGQDFAFVNRND